MTNVKTLSMNDRNACILSDLLISLLGATFLAIFSHFKIWLPFTPIPLTLQTFVVFLLGGMLGSRRGVYSILIYLLQGCFGLPVFAGGTAHLLWFIDPKAGFLISFIASVYLIGKMIENRYNLSIFYLLMTLSLAQLVIWGIGMIWLSFFVGLTKAFLFGVLPFLSAAMLKICAATCCLKCIKHKGAHNESSI